MRKIKNLIFIILIMVSLFSFTFAYNVGDIISAGISGYCPECNEGRKNPVTASGINAIAGETAAVSYTGSTSNPDLKYGTVVYVESIGKSYVINDVGSMKRGGKIGVEPFCNNSKEENAITTPNGKPTNVKILFIPNQDSVKKNVQAGLEFLRSGATGNSGSTQSNKCIRCGGTIGDKWYETTDGKHYKACTANHDHQYDIHDSDYTGFAGNCKVCGKKPSQTSKTELNSSILPGWITNSTQKGQVITEKHTLFSDLPDSHWGYADVKAMKDLGIVKGQGNGMLGTNNNITAEEFLTLLSQVVTKKGVAKSQGESYIPVGMSSRDWSFPSYIDLTKILGNTGDKSKKLGETELKLILGNNDSEVLENYKKPITREKVANITGAFVNSANSTSVNILNAKDWNTVNSTYKKRINNLVEKGILKGSDNGDGTINVNPKTGITRVEAICLINRLYNAL